MTTCCLSPDRPARHSAYCITQGPRRHGTGTGIGSFGHLSDTEVMRQMHMQADVCVRVMAMPEAERHAPGPKGAASPAQAAALNAVIAMHLEREARTRGLIGAE